MQLQQNAIASMRLNASSDAIRQETWEKTVRKGDCS